MLLCYLVKLGKDLLEAAEGVGGFRDDGEDSEKGRDERGKSRDTAQHRQPLGRGRKREGRKEGVEGRGGGWRDEEG